MCPLLYHPKPTPPSRHESRRYLYFCTSTSNKVSTCLVCVYHIITSTGSCRWLSLFSLSLTHSLSLSLSLAGYPLYGLTRPAAPSPTGLWGLCPLEGCRTELWQESSFQVNRCECPWNTSWWKLPWNPSNVLCVKMKTILVEGSSCCLFSSECHHHVYPPVCFRVSGWIYSCLIQKVSLYVQTSSSFCRDLWGIRKVCEELVLLPTTLYVL